MNNYDESTYGDKISDAYDEMYASFDPDAVRLLANLARDGPALELGIGTGRLALPLLQKGVEVWGIDASQAMLNKLRSKPLGNEIKTLTGSFAEFEIEQRFQLIYVVFNTFFALLTQEEQVQCFRCVCKHLTPDGVFLIEAFVPDMARFEAYQTIRTIGLTEDNAQLELSIHDPLTQQVYSQHVFLNKEGNRFYPVKLRYAWPSELDLMAQLGKLRLQDRWGAWNRSEFTRESSKHISVYRREAFDKSTLD